MEPLKANPGVVRRYYGSSREVLLDCYAAFDKTVTLYGPNQLHEEVVTLLPCGNPPKQFAGEIECHEELFHSEICDGKEHVSTCAVPSESYLKIWGTCCNLQCKVFLLGIKEDVETCFSDAMSMDIDCLCSKPTTVKRKMPQFTLEAPIKKINKS